MSPGVAQTGAFEPLSYGQIDRFAGFSIRARASFPN